MCDKDALQLEVVLAQFSEQLKERGDSRRYVSNVYERILSAISSARSKEKMDSVAELLSRHLDFQTSEEERERLRLIEKAIDKVEGE